LQPTWYTTQLTKANVQAELSAGKPVQVCYQWGNGSGMHFALIVGKFSDGHFLVYDPYFGIKSCDFANIQGAYGYGFIPRVRAGAIFSYMSKRYQVVLGQEEWASTHAPSGTEDGNQGWLYVGPGGVDLPLDQEWPGVPPAIVSHNANRYQTTIRVPWVSFNPPSGDPDCWVYLEPGGDDSSLNIPIWSSGMTCCAAGWVYTFTFP
jgi:hypothetical protein